MFVKNEMLGRVDLRVFLFLVATIHSVAGWAEEHRPRHRQEGVIVYQVRHLRFTGDYAGVKMREVAGQEDLRELLGSA